MRVDVRPVRAALLAALLGACGGGGGGYSPPPPPPPPPPAPMTVTFTSATTVSTPESRMAPFYTVSASSSAGEPVQFLPAGGADAALFIFSGTTAHNPATGTLRFAAFPDFENPADANRDNVYEYQFRATDGVSTQTLNLQITVTNVTGGFRVRQVYNAPIIFEGSGGCPCPGVITGTAEVPGGNGRLAVATIGGRINYGNTTNPTSTPLADVAADLHSASGASLGALYGIAFSPNFAVDRAFYIYINNRRDRAIQVLRYQVFAANREQADPSTKDVVLSFSTADLVVGGGATPLILDAGGGGMFTFDKNGHLLIGVQDSGITDGAQNPNLAFGKLLRVDVSSDAFPADPNRDYAIPPGNAYPGGVGGLQEIWALGLRGFAGSVDSLTGDVFIADVGDQVTSEIDRIPFGTPGPINFGWSLREGTRTYRGADSPAFTAPVAEVPAVPGRLAGIGGVLLYRGPSTLLQGQLLFNGTNKLYSVSESSLMSGATLNESAYTNRTDDFYAANGLLGGGLTADFYVQDAAGNAYLINSFGYIFKIEAAD